MSEEIRDIQLNFSCQADWPHMPETEGGRFCDKCQKKVYDFTSSKASEFQKILVENNYNVCGRFNSQQMAIQPVKLPFWKKWLSAAMVLIGINYWGSKAVAQHTKHKSTKHAKKVVFPHPSNFMVGDIQIKATHAPTLSHIEKFDENSVLNGNVKSDTSKSLIGSIEVTPEYPGGIEKFYTFVKKNIGYNQITLNGRVIVTFIIETDGSLIHPQVLKGITGEIDNKVLQAVSLSPKWIPGKQNGKAVKMQYTVPILFK